VRIPTCIWPFICIAAAESGVSGGAGVAGDGGGAESSIWWIWGELDATSLTPDAGASRATKPAGDAIGAVSVAGVSFPETAATLWEPSPGDGISDGVAPDGTAPAGFLSAVVFCDAAVTGCAEVSMRALLETSATVAPGELASPKLGARFEVAVHGELSPRLPESLASWSAVSLACSVGTGGAAKEASSDSVCPDAVLPPVWAESDAGPVGKSATGALAEDLSPALALPA
jgi:hypothetical protein